MSKPYSQFKAFNALTKGSLLAILKSPSALFFSIAFPLIFITVFGVINNGGFQTDIAIDPRSDTTNQIYLSILHSQIVNIVDYKDSSEREKDFKKGKLAAILNIQNLHQNKAPFYKIDIRTCQASGNDKQVAIQLLNGIIDGINKSTFKENQTFAELHFLKEIEGRSYKYLDFFLPGMLGFSLLSAGIFGTAFLFFSLRQTLVLKRFFATPVNRIYIILSEGIARLIMQIMAAAIIIGVGHFAFGFTLVHGLSTFIQMLILSAFGLMLFLGMGFVISSLAKSESSIPPLANMITMPQLLLSGVFLSVSNFPSWLQPFCKALPLTQLNSAMRAVAFEGKNIFECGQQLLILSIWLILVYLLAVKVFRWE